MKKITLIVMLFLAIGIGNAQTALTAGDIAFVGSNADGMLNSDDTVAFVLLKDIDAATTIIFTDMGWNDGTGFFTASGDGEFTWTSGIARSAGDVVTIDMGPLFPAAYSTIGDQLFAIQGSTASPTFIAGLQYNDASGDDGNWDGSAISNSTSALPNALVTGTTAVRLVPEQDNWQFSCALAGGGPITGTPAQIRAIVNNRANWVSNDSTPYNPALESGCGFTVTSGGDTTPPVIVCAPTPAPISAGINGLAAIPDLVSGTTATDNVSIPANITITQAPVAGTMVGAGVYSVVLTATDEAGNSATCTITVTINEPPFTVLNPGEVAFVGFNLDGNDGFAFIILKDIIAGTNIKFTDCGVSNPNTISCVGAGGEGSATWYAPSAMMAGDIVTLPGSFLSGSILSAVGDQLFAYQGTAASPNFITAIHCNVETGVTNDTDWDGANTSNSTTALPDQLTNGVNAIRLYAAGPPETEIDNWQFDCTSVPGGFPITGTALQLSAIINDIQYWTSNDLTEYVPTAKAGCLYNVLPPDVTPPVAVCMDATLSLDATGNATLSASDVDGGSSDNSGSFTLSVSPSAFTCANVGANTVTLTVTDPSGNSSTCTATVTVEDTIAPTATCQDFTVQLDATGNAVITAADINNGSSDNCGIASLSVSPSTFDCTNIGSNSVTLTVTDVNNNSSICNATVTVVDTIDPVAVCKDITVTLDASGNATITADDVDNGSNDNCSLVTLSVSQTTFSCADVGTNSVLLTVTDFSGNTATCNATVTVQDNVAPTVVCQNITVPLDATGNATITAADVDNGSSDACGIVSLSVAPSTFTCSEIGANTVTLTVQDINGNSETCTAVVTITDPLSACNQPPIAVCQPVTVNADGICEGNAVATDFDGGSSDPDGDPLTFAVSPVGPYPVGITNVTLTVSDGTLSDSCNTTITVVDSTPPTANCAAPFTIQLDSNGNASISVADIDAGSSDNCGIASTAIDISNFTCADVGPNTVTLTVFDVNGNSATCSTIVTVQDTVAPIANCAAPFTIQLDATGNASISVADIDNGSSDACGIASTSIDVGNFTCANVGPNTVTLTVFDVNGNSATCTTIVTVQDTIAPIANCAAPFTIQLDATGNASISVADIDNGSSDACGIASTSIDVGNFTCADVGPNTVTLTVFDVNGNSATCTTIVTVQDSVAPIANCAAPFTIQLDANGNASISVADIDNGSSDACGIASTAIDISNFTCADVGPNTVTLTVTDINGNSSTCTTIVTVVDTLVPSVICTSDITVNTDAGNCAAIVNFPMPITSDNCGVATVVQTLGDPSGSAFPVGINVIEFTATDVNGNSNTCSFTITVVDNEAPVAVCQNITIPLDPSGNASIVPADVDGGSTDQCGIANIAIDIDTFDCSDVGDNNVVLSVTDVNGNVATCIAIVTVEDVTAPIVACQNLTVELDANSGTVTISGTDIDNGSTDACGIATYSLDIDTFDCSNIGDNTVVLTVTDVNGNSASCTAIVTVEDNTSPTLVCQDFTIAIGPEGTAILNPSDVIATNDDACGIFTTAVDITEFTCADIGTPITVQVFSQDNNGNLSTCTATVTAVDLLGPEINCPANQTVDPGAGNLFYIVPDYFGTGAAMAIDNCTDPVVLTTQDPEAGTALPDGTYTITLTATDAYGNSSSCQFELEVESVIGVEDQNFSSLTIYPVPTKNNLRISNPQSIDLEILEIYDLRGRLVQQTNLKGMNTHKTVDVSKLAAASYYVKIIGKSGQIIKRMLKE
ncbi:HYR domain-containing protein [Vitellibacter sp. q18]|nr:HYR domain-containing protein [Aequorivita lutea]